MEAKNYVFPWLRSVHAPGEKASAALRKAVSKSLADTVIIIAVTAKANEHR